MKASRVRAAVTNCITLCVSRLQREACSAVRCRMQTPEPGCLPTFESCHFGRALLNLASILPFLSGVSNAYLLGLL